jgi:hypothetical protein
MPFSKRMLRVMRCAITSPAKLRLLIALRRETETVNLVSEENEFSMIPLSSAEREGRKGFRPKKYAFKGAILGPNFR